MVVASIHWLSEYLWIYFHSPPRILLHVLQAFKDIRDKVQIATKFSFHQDETGKRSVRGDPAHVRAACEGSLQRLGIDCIDLYYQHRLHPNTPIEVTVRVSSSYSRLYFVLRGTLY